MYTYKHPRPSVAIDLVLFGIIDHKLVILTGRRAEPPYKGRASLPGAYVYEDESAEETCTRKIKSIGLKPSYLEQLVTLTDPYRDPRGRVIAIAYYGLIPIPQEIPTGDTKIDQMSWITPEEVQKQSWAFDHKKILDIAIKRLRAKIQYSAVSPHFFPEEFTVPELAAVYCAILGRSIDVPNFRRDLLRQNLLVEVGTKHVRGPRARTYNWNWKNKEKFFLSLG